MNRTQIVVSDAVRDYVRALAPDTRRICKSAINALPEGDTTPLEDEYAGFFRLRVGSHRFIYRFHRGRIEVFFAETRRLVYDLLAARIAQILNPADED